MDSLIRWSSEPWHKIQLGELATRCGEPLPVSNDHIRTTSQDGRPVCAACEATQCHESH